MLSVDAQLFFPEVPKVKHIFMNKPLSPKIYTNVGTVYLHNLSGTDNLLMDYFLVFALWLFPTFQYTYGRNFIPVFEN